VGSEWFSALITQKAVTGAGHGEISGYASIYGNVDLQDDVMEPGAANKTVADWQRSKSKVPLLDWHGDSLSRLIGSVSELKTAPPGLWFKAGFADTPEAQRARQLAQEGHLSGVSIGYLPLRQSFKNAGDRMIRHLHEIKLLEISLTPVPANPLAQVGSVKGAVQGKAVSDTPWSQFTQADYTPAQWARACLIDTGQGAADSKDRYKLPVREPSGTLNRNAVHAAAGGHGVSAVTGVPPEMKAAAARKLVALYRGDLGEDPPESLLRMAGMSHASLDYGQFADAMRAALGIGFEPAAKAAADLLVAAYQPLDDAAGTDDGQPTAGAAAPEEGTAERVISDEASARYALSFINPSGPRDGAPGGEPPTALAGPLARLEIERASQDMDRLEAEIQEGRR